MARLMAAIESMFEPNRRWTDYEIYTLAEIARHPTAEQECETIVKFHASLPSDSKMFPFSVIRLLEKWVEILDRAGRHARATGSPKLASISEKIHLGYELKRVEARVKELRKILDNEMSETPTPEHRVEIKKLKARRQELLTTLNLSC